MEVIIIFVLLSFLYLSHRLMSRSLSRLVRRLGGGDRTVIWLWSLLLLPGTILHEISHFFAAAASGARTGKIEIFPDSLEDDLIHNRQSGKVTLGYVRMQTLNPLQGFLVGFSPFVFGLAAMVVLSALLSDSYQTGSALEIICEVYLFFTIANSMFPSSSDLLHTLPLIIILIIIAAIALFLGFQFIFAPDSHFLSILDSLRLTLIISLLINFCLYVIFWFWNTLI